MIVPAAPAVLVLNLDERLAGHAYNARAGRCHPKGLKAAGTASIS